MQALTRAVAFQVRGRLGRRTLARIGDHGRMWAALHLTAASKVVYANPPDWNEMRAWKRLLGTGDQFIDVGANVGAYALWAGGLGARVIALEPDREAVELLRENVALNAFDIRVLEAAVGAEEGEMVMTTGLDSVNHLVLESDAVGQKVRVVTLDSLLDAETVAGVKIDVEGAERLVLEGARVALSQGRIRVLQLEWNEMSLHLLGEDRMPVAEILSLHGYRLFRADEAGFLHSADIDFGADIFALAPDVAPNLPSGIDTTSLNIV